MKVTTRAPEISALQKQAIAEFLTRAFSNKELEASLGYALQTPQIYLWVGNTPRYLYDGHWQMDQRVIYLARDSVDMDQRDKLAVLLGMMQLIEPTDALTELAEQAIANYLLHERRELNEKSLIVANEEVTGIAFNDDQIASLVGGEWLKANGETVDVHGAGWTVAATEMPPTPPPAPVEADIQF